MKILFKSSIIPVLLLVFFGFTVKAQTATGILDNYIKKSGGIKAWQKVKAITMKATVNQDEETVPVEIYSTSSGKQALILKFPGMDITQMAFDGDVYWTTDIETLSPKRADEEMVNNMRQSADDFPIPALNYRKNGYTIAFMGLETKNGAETYKVKVIQKPLTINGTKVPNASYYYFDTSTYLPVAVESLQPDGSVNRVTMDNYQQVDGLYFPFSINQDGLAIAVKSVEVNPEIDSSVFTFPQKKEGNNKEVP